MIVERKAPGMELIDVLDRVLDKGTVIDASARLRLAASDLRRMRTRIVVDSVETYPAAARSPVNQTLHVVKQEAKPVIKKINRRRTASPSRSKPR